MTRARPRHGSGSEPAVLLVDKPVGPSSHAVVDWLRWVLREPKIGHCGTLDPAASGLLVVCVGAATRLVPYLTGADKTYRATIVVGRSTTTADAQGDVVCEEPCVAEDAPRACEALANMVGTLRLPPPRFSAIKVQGVRAHALARSGDAPHLAPRDMRVLRVDGIESSFDADAAAVVVQATLQVSKGPYVRSLAEALGDRIGRPAHLGALRRCASGSLRVDDPRIVGPLSVSSLDPDRRGKPRWRVRPRALPDDADRGTQQAWVAERQLTVREAAPLPFFGVQPSVMRRLLSGQAVELDDAGIDRGHVGLVGVGAHGSTSYLVGRIEGGRLAPQRTIVGA